MQVEKPARTHQDLNASGRAKAMQKMKDNRYSLREIGEFFGGLSRQRVFQILKKYGTDKKTRVHRDGS